MKDFALFDQIIAKLRLKSEATQALVCLDEYVSNFFTPQSQTDLVPLFEQLPNDLPKIFKDTFLKESLAPENQLAVKKTVDYLKHRLQSCNTVQLTIAFKPDEAAISMFSDWVKTNVGQDTLIDLQFDKSIVGGAQIVTRGLYKDYSVRKILAGRFQIQREEIMDILK